MLEQGYITQATYQEGIGETLPSVNPPNDQSKAPYFTSWVRQQLVDRYNPHTAFEGGLRVRTTLDLDLQAAAQHAVDHYLTARACRRRRSWRSTTRPAECER